MKQRINKNKRISCWFVLFIVFASFHLCEALLIQPLIRIYGETTDGYVSATNRDAHGVPGFHYYYLVSGKEYKCNVLSDKEYMCKVLDRNDWTVEVKYLKFCPRIHMIIKK